jgi:hypothetical protein
MAFNALTRIGIALMVTAAACGRVTGQTEAPMTGVVFFKTVELEELTAFYTQRVGAELWMDQDDCRIFRHGQFLFGFCQREESETCGILTFVYPDREGVDRMYELFTDEALHAPKDNPRYPIYNFFARDPEGRLIEFQMFTGEVDWN